VIVKGIASPIKPKPSTTRDSVRDSPKNPFLDSTGETNLAQKAEKMGMKAWNVKSNG
jgi:hypothetical protein